MTLHPGTRLGPYEVIAPLGAGGMGAVYRARDIRLGRTVAIKVLPPESVADGQLRSRFEREARAISALAHPNICTLYDIGEQDGQVFLVMEHIEGETLFDRLRRGPLPLDKALEVATEVTTALSVAHKQEIVHRDLKPANVMLTKTGAKLLDFGLARLASRQESPAVVGLTSAQTESGPLTGRGTIVGTLPYMAPEQIEGGALDARTDLWALGTLVYEMVTGKRPFAASSQVSLIGAILERDPEPIAKTLPLAPPSLDRLVRRCLAKNPDDRWDTAHDVAEELRWIRQTVAETGSAAGRPDPSRTRTWLAAAGLTLLGAAAGASFVGLLRDDASPAPVVARTFVDLRPADRLRGGGVIRTFGGVQGTLALSRDGRQLAFNGLSGNSTASTLYVRPLDGSESRPIVVGGTWPAFSPDGAWIAFKVRDQVQKAAVGGGPAVKLCSVPDLQFVGLDWGDDDNLVFSSRGMLWRVPASGGEPEALTKATLGETHVLPHVLPRARAIIYTVQKYRRLWGDEQIVVQTLPGGVRKRLVRDGTDAHFLHPGYLVFIRLGTLLAAPFDPSTLELTGGPVGMQEDVAQVIGEANDLNETGAGQFATSGTGTLAYVSGRLLPPIQGELVWVDRQGRTTPLPGLTNSFWPSSIRLSPDGRRVATTTATHRESSLWINEVDRDSRIRIPTSGQVTTPEWTRDGRRLAFSASVEGTWRLFVGSADGTGSPQPIELGDLPEPCPASWTPDGRTLAVVSDLSSNALPGTTRLSTEEGGSADIWTISFEEPSTVPRKLIATPAQERCPAFSPDGRWIAYSSNDSGRDEVYVEPYPARASRVQVSTGGGSAPAWHPNGREMFYSLQAGPTGSMLSVELSGSAELRPSKPRQLFEYSTLEMSFLCGPVRSYDVSRDGERLVVIRKIPDPSPPPLDRIQLVHSWVELVKVRVPRRGLTGIPPNPN